MSKAKKKVKTTGWIQKVRYGIVDKTGGMFPFLFYSRWCAEESVRGTDNLVVSVSLLTPKKARRK